MSTTAASVTKPPWQRAIRALTKLCAYVAAAIIIFMMVSTVADVGRRLILGQPIPGVIEVGELLMVGSVFLGIAYTEARREHVAVDLLIRRLSPRKAAITQLLGLLIVIATLIWMIVVTASRAWVSVETGEFRFGLVKIPVWPGRVAIAVGLITLLLELIVRLVHTIKVALPGSHEVEPS